MNTYKSFYKTVTGGEGLIEISELFYKVASIEAHHSKIFTKIKEEITVENYYQDEGVWKCLNCGYELKDTTAPSILSQYVNIPQKYFKKGMELS